MTLRERIEADLRDAMRRRDAVRRDALRFLKSQIQLGDIAQRKLLDDSGVAEVIAKQVKDRRESIKLFEQGHRADLMAKESAEVAILEEYLPARLSTEELAQLVQDVIRETGASGIRDKGRVMGRLMPQVRGKADGSEVNALVTQLLESGTGPE